MSSKKAISVVVVLLAIFALCPGLFAQVANDGNTAAEKQYSNSLTSYSVYWSGFATAADHMQVLLYVNNTTGAPVFSSNNVTGAIPWNNGSNTYTNTITVLTANTLYVSVVYSLNAAGTTIYQSATTPGFWTDNVAPVNGTVNNTNGAGAAITFQQSNSTLYTNWSGFSDAFSGINTYSVGILSGGTGAGSPYVVALTSYASTATSATFTGLVLTSGTKYYVAIQATDKATNVSALVYSSGVTVDTAPPLAAPLLDSAFGTAGVAVYSSGNSEYTKAVTVAGGYIYAVGYITIAGKNNILVTKFKPNGTPDTTFGTGGAATYYNGVGTDDQGRGAAVDASGNLFVVGYISPTVNMKVAVLKYKTDGTLDITFGTNGVATYDYTAHGTIPNKIVIDSGGKIYVAVQGQSVAAANDFIVVRFNSNGTLDGTFGSTYGGATASTGAFTLNGTGNSSDGAEGIAIVGSSIYAAGYSFAASYDVAVVKLTSTGTLDTTFNTTGIATYDYKGGTDSAEGIAVDASGNLFVSAKGANGAFNDFLVLKYKSNGLDTTFGTNGVAIQTLGANYYPFTIAFDSLGNLIVSAYRFNSGNSKYYLRVVNIRKTDGAILAIGENPTASNVTTIDNLPGQMALGADGGMFVADDGGTNIYVDKFKTPVNDGLGADLTYQSSTTTISANWSGFSDTLSGMLIGANTYQVGVSTGNTPTTGAYVQALTNYANTATSATFGGLALTSGTIYYVEVEAFDAVGNMTAVYSNGVTVDTAPPTGGTVTANSGNAFQSSTTTFNAAWANWSDALSGMASGTSTYQVGIQIWGGANIYALSPFSAATSSYAFTGLTLTSGTKYYAIFTATDAVGNATAIIYSNGVTVDTAAPVPGTVTNAGGGVVQSGFQSSATYINGSWTNWNDALSGMLVGANTYSIGIVNAAGTQIVAMTNYANTATSVSFTGLVLTNGTKYYVVMTGQDAVGNTTAIIYSNGITVDTTGPTAGTVTNTGAGTVSGSFQSSTNTINASWANWGDSISGMLVGANTYQVGVGTTAGATNVVALANYSNTTTSASFTGLTLTSGTTYYVTIIATNVAGNTTTLNSAGRTVDTAPPTGGVVNNTNSAGTTITFQQSNSILYTNWSGWTDALSGMGTGANTYQVGILSGGTGAGATYVVALTNYANAATSATFTGLVLTSGTKYYVAMNAQDAVGNVSALIYSNGVTVDTAAPVAGTVTNAGGGVVQSGFQSSATYINGSWANWNDALSGMLVGANTYSIGIVNAAGTQIVAMTNYANTATSVSFTGLVLTNGTKYYVVMTGQDAVGNTTAIIYSNGITVDTTGPTAGTVTNTGAGTVSGSFQSSATAIFASWANWGDSISGMVTGANTYQVGVGTTAGATNVVALTNYANTATSASFTGLSLTSGTTYYVTVIGTNVAGNTTTLNSTGRMVDTAPPTGGVVNNTNGAGATITFQSSTATLYTNWSGFSDALSGMLIGANTYLVGVGTTPGATNVVGLTPYSNAATSATFTGLTLTSGTKYYVTVVASDALGNTATFNSAGVTVDTAPPSGGTVTANSGSAFQASTTTFNVGWANWSDALSGMASGTSTYQVGIQIWGGANIYALSPFSAATSSYAFTNLTLTSGTKYYAIFTAADVVGNTTAVIYSNGVTVDTNVPSGGTVTDAGGGTVSGGFQSSANTINANWANWGETPSGMLAGANTYQIGIVTSNGTQVVALTNYSNGATSAAFTGLTLTSGTKYYVVFTATDAAGATTSIIYSNGVTVDAAPPIGGVVNNTNGAGATITFQSSTSTLNANWSGFTDALSGMLVGANTYQVGVGTTVGGTNIVALTNYANTATSATFTGLTLTSGTKYYVTVVASDALGNTATFNSAGVTVDTAPPTGTVNNTNAAGATITTQSSTNALYVNWSFSDALSGMTTGASTYQVGLLTNTTPTSATIAGGALTNYSNTATSATFVGLTLTPGTKYYAEVITSDALGNATTVYSSGVTIVSGPTGGIANNVNSSGATISFQQLTSVLYTNWSGWTDAAAAINTYQVGVVTNPLTGTYIVALQNYVSTLSSATFTGLTLTNGTKYYIQVTAVDALSNSATVYSSGVMVDIPTAGVINNGTGANVSFQSSTNTITANWSGFSDTISGVTQYQVGVGTTPGATNTVALTTYANTATSATLSGTFVVGTSYYVTIVATSGSGFTTTVNGSALTIASAPMITSFTGSPTSGTAPISITFTSAITSAPAPLASVVYNFGDGSTLLATSAGSVSHTYSTAGTYYANVTATNGVGSASSTTAVVITAPANAPAGLTLTANTASGSTPYPVTFTFNATGADPVVRHELSFDFTGAGINTVPGVYNYSSSTAGSYTFTYNLAGNYTVSYRATDAAGIATAITYANTIAITASTPPTFSVLPAASPAGPYSLGQPITFIATGTAGAGAAASAGGAIYYQWYLSGGGQPDISTAAHTGADTETFSYATPGTYTVTCVISDSNGSGPRSSTSATTTVTVAAPSPTNISVSISNPLSGITFYGAGSGLTVSVNAAPAANVNISTVSLQYKLTTSLTWLTAPVINFTGVSNTAVMQWITSTLSVGTYNLRASVTDTTGVVHYSTDPGGQGMITVTDVATISAVPVAVGNTAEYVITGGGEKFIRISNASGINTSEATGVTGLAGVSVNLPANATSLAAGATGLLYTDTLTSSPVTTTSGIVSGGVITGFCDLHITDSTGATALLTKPISITIEYNITGTSITDPSTLQLMHYNAALAKWETLPGQVLDTTHKTITASGSSLSPFALAGVAAIAAGGGGAGGGLGLGGLAAVALCGTTGLDALIALTLVFWMSRYLRRSKVKSQR